MVQRSSTESGSNSAWRSVRRRGVVWARLKPVLIAVLGWCTATAAVGQALPSASECKLIEGAGLITFVGEPVERPSPARDVLVCGTKIMAVGEPGSLTVPETAMRIDAQGKVLLPGLVDGHVHLFAPLDLELNLAWGVTGVRNLFGNPGTLSMRQRIAEGELWGPRIFTAGPIIDGKPAIWPGSASVTTAAEAEQAVETHVKAGYDFIKVYSLLQPEPFFAAIKAADEAGKLVGGHVPGSVPLADAVRGGMDFIEHLSGFVPALQGEDSPWIELSQEERKQKSYYERGALQLEGFSAERLPKAAGWMVEQKVWNIPTFVVQERISASAEQKTAWLEGHEQMRTVSPMARNMWNPENDFRLRDVPPELLAARRESATLYFPIVKALHEAGAELMLGTDTPNPFVFPGYSVHEELRRFVQAGLSPWQALRTATVQPARFMGKEDVYGQIKVGMDADLLLLEASPLQEISNTEKIVGVMTRGRWLDRAALDGKLDRVAKAYGNE